MECVKCLCGGKYKQSTIKSHEKTKRHIAFIKTCDNELEKKKKEFMKMYENNYNHFKIRELTQTINKKDRIITEKEELINELQNYINEVKTKLYVLNDVLSKQKEKKKRSKKRSKERKKISLLVDNGKCDEDNDRNSCDESFDEGSCDNVDSYNDRNCDEGSCDNVESCKIDSNNDRNCDEDKSCDDNFSIRFTKNYYLNYNQDDKQNIYNVIMNLLNENINFYNEVKRYEKKINIYKGLHKDKLGQHFNIFLGDYTNKSDIYHIYIDSDFNVKKITKLEFCFMT